jgi:hypothetical protein
MPTPADPSMLSRPLARATPEVRASNAGPGVVFTIPAGRCP